MKFILLCLLAFACPLSVAAEAVPDAEAQAALWQTDEDAAFAEARRRIAEDGPELNFSDLTALRTLPPEIAGLTGLQALILVSTGVTDLAPLAGLTRCGSIVHGLDDVLAT